MGIGPPSPSADTLVRATGRSSDLFIKGYAAKSTKNSAVGNTVHAGPPAPSEHPPSKLQSA